MSANPWEGWQFLTGEWSGEGGGEPGQGSAEAFSVYTEGNARRK